MGNVLNQDHKLGGAVGVRFASLAKVAHQKMTHGSGSLLDFIVKVVCFFSVRSRANPSASFHTRRIQNKKSLPRDFFRARAAFEEAEDAATARLAERAPRRPLERTTATCETRE